MTAAEDRFSAAWADRETRLYGELFGPPRDQRILVPDIGMFAEFGWRGVDPRWLHVGTRVHAPTPARPTFVHVTSGLTNDWADAGEPGLGAEFLMETSDGSDWASHAMTRIACYSLLLSAGLTPGREAILPGDRLPLWDPPEGSLLAHLLVHEPAGIGTWHRTAFGEIALLRVTGITEAERVLAAGEGTEALMARLSPSPWFPMTQHRRQCSVAANTPHRAWQVGGAAAGDSRLA